MKAKTVFFSLPCLRLTVGGVLQHQALQLGPLGVEPLHQLVGVHWVAQVALWVRGGDPRQVIQLVGPAERRTECFQSSGLSNDFINLQHFARLVIWSAGGTEPFDSGQLGLLCFNVVPQRLDQLFLCVDQVRHVACRGRHTPV